MMAVDATMSACNLDILDSLENADIEDIVATWNDFCLATEVLLLKKGNAELFIGSLCKHGLGSLAQEYFFSVVEEAFKRFGASKFWQEFDDDVEVAGLENSLMSNGKDMIQEALCKALVDLSSEKQYQEDCIRMLIKAGRSKEDKMHNPDAEGVLLSKYQQMISSTLLSTLPWHFPDILRSYFKQKLEELNACGDREDNNGSPDKDMMDNEGGMDIDGSSPQDKLQKIVKNVGMVVLHLKRLGFSSMAEDAYSSTIFTLLKAKVHNLAGEDYRSSVLKPMKEWIKAVPLQFLHQLLKYLDDPVNDDIPTFVLKSPLTPNPFSFDTCMNVTERLLRWQLQLEYSAYETLQDLRIGKLFEIIVDFPESTPAIEDLKQCLQHTGQHAKLVDSFMSALRYRLLTPGASTNDILHHYVSTIKALRTLDPGGVFLEVVGEPIMQYLKGRKDTSRCIVSMLTDGSGGSPSGAEDSGDCLLQVLSRAEESQEHGGLDEDFSTADKQGWVNAQNWEPDPVEADSLKCSRRKASIFEMIANIIGPKDHLVDEYRVMLAEKLLSKCDYDIDAEIRTLELLKMHFGEDATHKCIIMLNDMINSKRTNASIKAIINQSPAGAESIDGDVVSLDIINASIISSNFWPSIQDDELIIPDKVEQLLGDYAKRFSEIKTPRKLLWKKNLGTVKLELQFGDKTQQFSVTPMHASIIMQFQDQTRWTSINLAAVVGVPVDILNQRISFWVGKGVLSKLSGTGCDDHIFTLVDAFEEGVADDGSGEELLAGDDNVDQSVVSFKDQLREVMAVYERFITMMLAVKPRDISDIHKSLQDYCTVSSGQHMTPQQLQRFLSSLVEEEKLELRDGIYYSKRKRDT